jgi:hypothetical protein
VPLRHASRLIALLFLLGAHTSMAADRQDDAATRTAPLKGSRGTDVRAREAGTPPQQLALDATRIPEGDGALFVPSWSRPDLEPQVRVYLGDELVARGPTGRRLVVPPGRYSVRIGQGPEGWRATRNVTVKPDETTVVSRLAGSLRVTAVDRDGRPVALDYLIASADGHRIYGPETTAETHDYTATSTWVLPPGTYRIIPGTDAGARTGVATLVVPRDERVRLRFVTDDTATVIGTEPGDSEVVEDADAWRVRWIIGGSFTFGQAKEQLGSFSGMALRLDALTELDVNFESAGHTLRFWFDLEQSWFAFDPDVGVEIPFQKLDDQLRFDITYAYRAITGVAPYIRLLARSALLPQELRNDSDLTVTTRAADGTETVRELERLKTLELMPAFSPAILQQGGGLDVTPWDSRFGGFGVKVGFAARETFYRGGGLWVSETGDGTVTLDTLEDRIDYGPEFGAFFRLRPASWFDVRTDLDGFLSIEDAGVGNSAGFTFNWSSTVSFRLAEWAAVVYRATVHRDDPSLPAFQFRQSINLRFQYAIF